MIAKILAVIFDFGGVLVRMVDDRPRLKLAEQLGVPLSRLDDLVFFSKSAQQASMGKIRVREHWEAVGEALGIQPVDMPSFLEQYWSADDVNWRLLDYIRSLHPRYKVGLLSNAWDDLRQTMHNRWNIDVLFDELIISAEVGMVKPDPRIFHMTIERLGVKPGEAIFIDDILVNVEAARNAGLIAIQFVDTEQTLADLSTLLGEDSSGG
jgi:epoxide hydrolase-like predicted phosphatase